MANTFIERLQQAAKFAGAGDSQRAIAKSLELNPQTVNRWFKGFCEPNAEQVFKIARAWGIDAEWLKNGVGTMLEAPSDGLSQEERDLIKHYRSATAPVRDVIRQMTRAVRKSMVAVAMSIPPLLAPQPVEAAFSPFNIIQNTHWMRRWLRPIMVS
jgi:transcriptional regulator with XRE-family HTH domain